MNSYMYMCSSACLLFTSQNSLSFLFRLKYELGLIRQLQRAYLASFSRNRIADAPKAPELGLQ